MVVSRPVGKYSVLMISGYSGGNQTGFVYLYEPAGTYIGYMGIIREGAPLPANVQWPNGILNIYFHESGLVPLLDTLRYEKPITVQFNADLKWGSLGTGQEPVGEQETPSTQPSSMVGAGQLLVREQVPAIH
jgi:hypothetical protein